MNTLYKITSPSGKIYVGQTVDPFKLRMHNHKSKSKTNKKGCSKLNNSIRKYGWDNMKKEIIMECSSLIMLNHIEDRFVEMWSLRNRDIGMNLRRAGKNATGYKHTDETKRKISEANKGYKHTDETKRKISEANKGKKPRLGKKHTEETKKKISESKKGCIPWNKGLKFKRINRCWT